MLRIRKISNVVGMKVFTDSGDDFGVIEEANLLNNKIDSWRIKIAKNTNLANFLGPAKGVVVPHQFVKAIGDIIIISKSAIPTHEEKEAEEEEE